MRLLLFLLILTFTASFAQDNSALENGKMWYEKRAEEASGVIAKSETIDKAIGFFEKALDSEDTEEAAVYLMKCYYFKGTFVETEKDKRKEVYEMSRTLGEKMTTKYPKSPAIKYWHLANTAKWGETIGIMKAAKEGLADILKTMCEELIALDPNFRNGGGYRMLGIINFKTPYIPMILSWPSDEEAIKNLEKSLEITPGNILGNLYLAQVLYDEGETERAIEILEKLAKRKPSQNDFLEDKKDIAEAIELLNKYKK
ncbi:MAG: tetratricopeptide repeat protein [Bacteroidota bacterium]